MGKWMIRGAILMAAALSLTGCNRNAAPISACNGDQPAIPRIHDVGPPNCPN